ncbi:extracellular solute-binding protein [Paenibacillus sp. IB182496]|uniref:Extracellular solute-binding protein n=1 Tax=Paenibacillus sabuli TaxID=2772509 RepID=A0A927GR87_9BACL|nr:extracellular solute-binding protein [Paenibacillus sabuli]MBD2845041.1 extracellular solute-binding protein [Paenibacillus sabuli]
MGKAMKHKRVTLAIVLLLVLMVLAACSSSNAPSDADGTNATVDEGGAPEKSAGEDAVKEEDLEPLPISFMIPLYDAQPHRLEGNPAVENYESLLNIDLSIDYVPSANYEDKLSLTLAGGEMPDVLMVPARSLKSTVFINAARNDVFWDLTDEWEKYPNMKSIFNQTMLANISVDGRQYGIAIPRPTARVGMLYREDLFEKHAIKVPDTLEEFYEAAKLLKEKEPDIIPFSFVDQLGETPWNGIDLLTVSEGGFSIWGEVDGGLQPYYETEPHLTVLNTLRTMYSEQLINRDFAIVQGAQKKNLIKTGKAAMYFTAYDDLMGISDDLAQVMPDAKLALKPAFKELTNATSGHNGVFALPKSTVTTEEKRDAILSYFERALDDEIRRARGYGIEGETYELVDGIPTFISEEIRTEYTTHVRALSNTFINPTVTRLPTDTPLQTQVKDAFEKYAELAVPNAIDPFVSETYTERGGELDKILYDARVKFIMGELDEAGYASEIKKWRSQGGERIIEEYSEAFRRMKK